ncbi:MAG: hypothetical protein PF572_04425 [Patescibacteria group bacterium]|jgi:hypothetical protein|nr:hypothetical protein [Patescibacteria group bacterium]
MKHVWSILCQKSMIDQGTNALSLIDTLEEIQVGVEKDKKTDKITLQGLSYDLVSYIVRDNEKIAERGEININLIDPRKKVISTFKQNFEMAKGIKRMRVQMKFNGLTISSKGRYVFEVELKGGKDKKFSKVTELPLDVEIKIIENIKS